MDLFIKEYEHESKHITSPKCINYCQIHRKNKMISHNLLKIFISENTWYINFYYFDIPELLNQISVVNR